MEPLGLIGFLMFVAGLHLLWLGREEILFWLREFMRIFQVSLHRTAAEDGADARLVSARGKHHTLRIVGGFGLVLLGQLLLILDLALRLD